MTLGAAILLIFLLYLVDKHGLWRPLWKWTAKITVSAIVLSVLSFGGYYTWLKYDQYQTEKQAAAYQQRMQPIWDCEARYSQFSNAADECEKNPSVVLVPIPPPIDLSAGLVPKAAPKPAPKKHVKIMEGVVNYGAVLYSENGTFGPDGEVLGKIPVGDRVEVLKKDALTQNVHIRTSAGLVGWIQDFQVNY